MRLREQIMTILKAQPLILAAVGTSKLGPNIYARRLPENPDANGYYPALLMSRLGNGGTTIMGNRNAAGTTQARIQFDCVGRSLQACEIIIEALFQSLHGKTGDFNGVELLKCVRDDAGEQDNSDPPDFGDDNPEYRITVDYLFLINEAVPTG